MVGMALQGYARRQAVEDIDAIPILLYPFRNNRERDNAWTSLFGLSCSAWELTHLLIVLRFIHFDLYDIHLTGVVRHGAHWS